MTSLRPLLLAVALLAVADEAALISPDDAEVPAAEEADDSFDSADARRSPVPASVIQALRLRSVLAARPPTAKQSGDTWLDCARRGTWKTPVCR